MLASAIYAQDHIEDFNLTSHYRIAGLSKTVDTEYSWFPCGCCKYERYQVEPWEISGSLNNGAVIFEITLS